MIVRQILMKTTMLAAIAVLVLSFAEAQLYGQFTTSIVEEDSTSQTIELSQGGSRRLKFDFKVPELLVENPEVIKATPVSPNEILVSGLKPGVSALTVSDADRNLHVINVHVTVDVRKLQRAISTHFPESSVTVHALQTGVVLKGNVARTGDVNNVMLVARDYFPTNVINQMKVGGGQTVAIQVKVYEVSRTKLRELGIDWSVIGTNTNIVSGFSDLITNFSDGSATNLNYRLGIFGDDTNLNFIIKALEQRNVAKLLDEPTLTAENGRPAEFLSGGEIPIQINNGNNGNSIEFRAFGTKLDMVPIIHGQGEMTLEVRAEVSEVANELSNGAGVPGFRVRRVNTGVRMRAGHTLALAGDYREEIEGEVRGLPHWMDKPIINSLFSHKEDSKNETELVFLITPRFVTDVPAHMVPNNLPGRNSRIPSDHEFYKNGYLEVPGCGDDCQLNRPGQQGMNMPMGSNMGTPDAGGYGQAGYPQGPQAQADYQQPPAVGNQAQGSFGYPGQQPATGQFSGGANWPQQ
jgi:pilus assembly protein CpaC